MIIDIYDEKNIIEAACYPEYMRLNVSNLNPLQSSIFKIHNKDVNCCIAAKTGAGKAQPLSSKILTPSGFKNMGDIKVGDLIIGSKGLPINVIGVFPQGKKEVYKVIFEDGSSTRCCKEHLWAVRNKQDKFRDKNILNKKWIIKDLNELIKDLVSNNTKWHIPLLDLKKTIEDNHYVHDHSELPLHPYLLGLLLGDGGIKYNVNFTTSDNELVECFKKLLPENCLIKYLKKYDYIISGGLYETRSTSTGGCTYTNFVKKILKELGLFGHGSCEKFIPKKYLYASPAARLELLQGIMDTDDSSNYQKSAEYSTCSSQLAQDILDLIRSLGGLGKIKVSKSRYVDKNNIYIRCKDRYTIYVNLGHLSPFKLSRKRNTQKTGIEYSLNRNILSIEKDGIEECQCILVDSDDHLYVTDDYILTHNTLCFEQFVSYTTKIDKKKAIYTAPLKALAKEKIDDWQDKSHMFSGLNLSICTGDYGTNQDRKKELENADIIVMTNEMLASQSRNKNNSYFNDVGLLVVDECFVGNTLIRVDNQVDLPISRIFEDDKITHVMAFDESTNQVVSKKILRKIRKESKDLISIKHEYGRFTCTKNHKIWTEQGYIKAGDLKKGDKLKWIPIENELTCDKCNKKFNDKKSCKMHILYKHMLPGENANHNKEIQKKCSKCGKICTAYGFASHFKSCGKPKKILPKKSSICDICGKTFKNATSRHNHRRHHFCDQDYYDKVGEAVKNSDKHKIAMKKMGENRKGKNNPIFRNPESYNNFKKLGAKRWASLSEEEKKAQIDRFINAPKNKTSDTKLEQAISKTSRDLPVVQTSGGKKWVTFKNGKHKNPDFIIENQRKVVEVGDIEFWHTKEEIIDVINKYKEIGIDCLYLTNEDVAKGDDYLYEILKNFVNNHTSEVISTRSWGSGSPSYVYDLEVEDCHNYFANGTLVSNCHLIMDKSRGINTEMAIINLMSLNPNIKLVFLSATMPNVRQLAEWSEKLNGKDCYLINSSYRPVPLHVHYEMYEHRDYYDGNERSKIETAIDILRQHPKDKFIIFSHTIETGKLMVNALEEEGIKTDFHFGSLEKNKRHKLEKEFKTGDLRVIVATSTLATGVNLPARRVISLGVHRGMVELEDWEILQTVGRAGRAGYDDRGDAYILLPHNNYHKWVKFLNNPKDIKSTFSVTVGHEKKCHYKNLTSHLVSEIHRGNIKNLKDLKIWHNKSFDYLQNGNLEKSILEQTIDLLLSKKIIKIENEEWKVTGIGVLSSIYYMNPFDVADWKRNWTAVFKNNVDKNDFALSIALGAIDSYRFGVVNRKEREEMFGYAKQIEKMFGKDTFNESEIKAGWVFYSLSKGKVPPIIYAQSNGYKQDFARVVQVLKGIDSMVTKWDKQDYFSGLYAKITYGVDWKLAPLCAIEEIGAKRAEVLYHFGIRTVYDVYDKIDEVKNLLKLNDSKMEKIKQSSAKIITNDHTNL